MLQLFLYSLIAGIATLAGAVVVILRRELPIRAITRLMGFGSGVLSGAAFLHLIPGATERAPLAAGWSMLIGLLAFIVIEQFVHSRVHLHAHHGIHPINVIGIMAFIALFIHSLVDGMAITAGFRASEGLGLSAAAAVIAHEVPEGIISVSLFVGAGYEKRIMLLLVSLVAFATPFGAIISWFWTVGISETGLAVLLGIAAISFIYVATADILPRLHVERDVPSFLYLLLGTAVPIALLFLEN